MNESDITGIVTLAVLCLGALAVWVLVIRPRRKEKVRQVLDGAMEELLAIHEKLKTARDRLGGPDQERTTQEMLEIFSSVDRCRAFILEPLINTIEKGPRGCKELLPLLNPLLDTFWQMKNGEELRRVLPDALEQVRAATEVAVRLRLALL